jgi:aromatic-L-amino-acid decarboxylase
MNIVCFRYRSRDADRVNAAIVADLQESGIAAPSATTLNGQTTIRAAIVNHRTGVQDLEALVAGVVKFGALNEARP